MKKILTSVSVVILLAGPGAFAKGGSNGGAKSGGSNMYKSGSQYKSKKTYEYEYQHKNKGDNKKASINIRIKIKMVSIPKKAKTRKGNNSFPFYPIFTSMSTLL